MLGRYCVYGEIARGGMATVHFGRLVGAVGFSRTVAIKRLHPNLASDPELVSMFIDEAKLCARIHHPNVVQTLDVVAVADEVALVMEYVQGESLSRLLAVLRSRNERPPLPIVGVIMSNVLAGLHAAHEARDEAGRPLGIVHRDMSPQNVMVGSDGVARVLDFGVAKVATRVDTTRQGIFKGKLAYASPEQVEGQPIDRRVDVFAASVVLWEMLTGRRLYKAESDVQLYTMVREGRIEHPSSIVGDLPDGLGWVVMKGLATDPNRRFSTALEMELALELVLPRASSRELAEWVKGVVPDALKARAQQLESIEAASKPTSDSGVRELTMITTPMPPPVAPAVEGARRSRRTLIVAAASFGALAIAAALLLWRIGARPSESPKHVAATEETPVAPAPKRSTPSPRASASAERVERIEAPVVAASADPPPRAAPPAPSVMPPPIAAPPIAPAAAPPRVVAPPPPVAVAKPPVSAAPTRSSAPAPTANCTPPYTVDADGIRHIKPECL